MKNTLSSVKHKMYRSSYSSLDLRPFHQGRNLLGSRSFRHKVNLHLYIYQVSTMNLVHLPGLRFQSRQKYNEIGPYCISNYLKINHQKLIVNCQIGIHFFYYYEKLFVKYCFTAKFHSVFDGQLTLGTVLFSNFALFIYICFI